MSDTPPQRSCTEPDCVNPARARNLCNKHYLRFRRHGTTRPPPRAAHTSLLGPNRNDAKGPTLSLWPARPQRITNQLHALAETPNLTLEQYERRKARILRGETT